MAALGADYALFGVGLSFASQSTILPAFAAYLGAPNVVIGAIPAVMTLGWFLPSLFAAGHTETLARKLPFVLRYTLAERIPCRPREERRVHPAREGHHHALHGAQNVEQFFQFLFDSYGRHHRVTSLGCTK